MNDVINVRGLGIDTAAGDLLQGGRKDARRIGLAEQVLKQHLRVAILVCGIKKSKVSLLIEEIYKALIVID